MSSDRIEFLKKDFVQGFIAFCGVEVLRADYGVFETCLKVRKEHRQQDGFVHAGVDRGHDGSYIRIRGLYDGIRSIPHSDGRI